MQIPENEKPKPIVRHPIVHDMHCGNVPAGCIRHEKLSIGRFRDDDLETASAVVELFVGNMRTNKMLAYMGCDGKVHRYIYSYDTYTLGVVEFAAEPVLSAEKHIRPVESLRNDCERLVKAVDALDGNADVAYPECIELAKANDAVRVRLGHPSRLARLP
jgi:hypothetical protein